MEKLLNARLHQVSLLVDSVKLPLHISSYGVLASRLIVTMQCFISFCPPCIPCFPDCHYELRLPLISGSLALAFLWWRQAMILGLLNDAPFAAESATDYLAPSNCILLDDQVA
jgi:hypothetical protein